MPELPERPERLDLRSHDIAGDRLTGLLELFPEARTEDGQIDFDQLKRALGEAVDPGKERYGLTWPGKADCFKTIQTPSLGTLLPAPEESVNWDTTENLIIEGDNLEVLKLLQKSYLGKVKMIYIDPPYNTGNDFIYPDDYAESLKTYLEYTGQVDAEGRRFSTNTDTDGRFHSKWLNMMYPRLYLARNLLRDDGVIFISIDDGEVKNLRALCDDIFGEENFLAAIAWEKRYTRSNNAKLFYSLKDTLVAYRRSSALEHLREARTEKSRDLYRNPDGDPRGRWMSSSYVNPAKKEDRPNLVYPINNPKSGVVTHPTHAWKYSRSEHERHLSEGRLWWGEKGDAKYPRLKNYLTEAGEGLVPIDIWEYESTGTTDEGGIEVKALFDGEAVFDNPKPSRLIRRMLRLAATDERDVVLDFFAGSGSTAQAVLAESHDSSIKRKFILVQLPEPTDRDDYRTIADITKERVRRVIRKLNDEKGEADDQDRGFRVFKLAESNFNIWESPAPRQLGAFIEQLQLHVDNVRDDRSAEDVLFELLLKSGYPLSATIATIDIDGKRVFSVGDGAFLVCLDQGLSLELMRAVAQRKPERFVVLDEGLANNDQLKANAVQIFKAADVTFRTV